MEFFESVGCGARVGSLGDGDVVFRSVGSHDGSVEISTAHMVSGERQYAEKLRQANLYTHTLGDEEQQEIQRRREASETRRRQLEQEATRRAQAENELQSRLARRRAASEESTGDTTGCTRSVSAPRRERPPLASGTSSVPTPAPPSFAARAAQPCAFPQGELQARLARRRAVEEAKGDREGPERLSQRAEERLVKGPCPARAVEMRLKRNQGKRGDRPAATVVSDLGAAGAAAATAAAPTTAYPFISQPFGELEARLAERRNIVSVATDDEFLHVPGNALVDTSRPQAPPPKVREIHEKENVGPGCFIRPQDGEKRWGTPSRRAPRADMAIPSGVNGGGCDDGGRRFGTPLRRAPLADLTATNGADKGDTKQQKELQAILARRRAVCDETEGPLSGMAMGCR